MDIEACLDCYCDPFYHDFYGINKEITDDMVLCDQSRDFLLKYALDDSDYKNRCIPILRKVFRYLPEKRFDISSHSVSDIVVKGFLCFSYYSAPLFWKETYEMIQKICEDCGDHYIYIIEADYCEKNQAIAFKLRIPVSKSWDELKNGGYISDVVFNMFNHNYYVFGDSGTWGRWCDYDNDYMDYEVFGYQNESPQILQYKAYFSNYITKSIIHRM